jgi:hypothetical protein
VVRNPWKIHHSIRKGAFTPGKHGKISRKINDLQHLKILGILVDRILPFCYNICIVKIKEQKMIGLTIVDGDVIRAYDFKPMAGREDCFIEGEVLDSGDISQGYQAYRIRVTRDSWSDSEDKGRVGIEMFVPWKVSFSEFQGRVMNLSR